MPLISDEVRAMLVEGAQLDAEKRELKRKIKELEDQVSEINVRLDEISTTTHRELLTGENFSDELTFKIGDVGSVELSIDSYFSVLAKDKADLVARFKQDEAAKHLVREEVNHKSLEAYCREVFRDTGAYPHGDIVNVYHKPVLKFKKG